MSDENGMEISGLNIGVMETGSRVKMIGLGVTGLGLCCKRAIEKNQ